MSDIIEKITPILPKHLPEILDNLIPNGKFRGDMYIGNNFTVNHRTGKWYDNENKIGGEDIISLWGHIEGSSESESVDAIAKFLGIGSNGAVKKPEPDTEKHPTVSKGVFDNAPFRILGGDHGQHFYLTKSTGQVIALDSGRHTKLNLFNIAPMEWWEQYFSGRQRGKVDWDAAVNALFITGGQMGIYNESKIRGCGVWHDEGRIVIHLGDRLMVEGLEVELHTIKSKYIYESSYRRYPALGKPIETEDSKKLIDITKMLAWERKINAEFLAGWCYLAPICGALEWRPHIWLTGSAGSGKTWIVENIISPVVGPLRLYVASETTAPAIRNQLKFDAVPVFKDEADIGKDDKSQNNLYSILELMRFASAESGAEIMKANTTGGALHFKIRSMFCLSSIGTSLTRAADESRTTVLSLIQHDPWDRINTFKDIKKAVSQTLTDEYCAGLRARAIMSITQIRKNVGVFSEAVATKLCDSRIGNQVGTLLAGAYSLTSNRLVSLAEAIDFIGDRDWSDAGALIEGDEIRCFNRIVQSLIPIMEDSKTVYRQVLQLVGIACGRTDFISSSKDELFPQARVGPDTANNALMTYGMRVIDQKLYLSTSSTHIEEMLKESPYRDNWMRLLIRIDGAERGNVRIFNQTPHAIIIPMEVIFEPDE